jgi:hypothetical protein
MLDFNGLTCIVMAVPVTAIHGNRPAKRQAEPSWMRGTRPRMTGGGL